MLQQPVPNMKCKRHKRKDHGVPKYLSVYVYVSPFTFNENTNNNCATALRGEKQQQHAPCLAHI